MTIPASLDNLRSTRTRIVKLVAHPRSTLIQSISAQQNIPNRDFSRFLGKSHPLRIIFVGHNPSERSWDLEAPYAHPTNKFWRLLREAQLVPENLCKPEEYKKLVHVSGIGFIDLFVVKGSDASKVRKDAFKNGLWKQDFCSRLTTGTGGVAPHALCCVSKIVAKKLLGNWGGHFGQVGTGQDYGINGAKSSTIWVLPSTSGRAAMTWEARLAPFKELALQVFTLDVTDEQKLKL